MSLDVHDVTPSLMKGKVLHLMDLHFFMKKVCLKLVPFPGGVLPYKSLMGMCRWMGSHFHDWSDYNGVAFSIELLEWGRKFSNFGGK